MRFVCYECRRCSVKPSASKRHSRLRNEMDVHAINPYLYRNLGKISCCDSRSETSNYVNARQTTSPHVKLRQLASNYVNSRQTTSPRVKLCGGRQCGRHLRNYSCSPAAQRRVFLNQIVFLLLSDPWRQFHIIVPSRHDNGIETRPAQGAAMIP